MNHLLRLVTSYFTPKGRSTTVRFMFPAIISFAALLTAAVITSDNSSYIRLEASDTTIMAGQQFSLDVYAYAHVPVNAVDISLRFDPDAVKVVAVDKGQSVLTLWTEEPTVENGVVTLSGGTFRRGFVKEHMIATINLQALHTGQSSLVASDVLLLAGDGSGSEVMVVDTSESQVNLYVYDENTDPSSIGVDVQVNVVTDIDGDGEVSLNDISAFMGAWSNRAKVYDFNGDGRMTFRDFSIILADFFFK